MSKLTSITIEYLMQYESFSNYKLGISKENQKIQYKVDDEISHIHKLEETRTPDEIITETTELLKSKVVFQKVCDYILTIIEI